MTILDERPTIGVQIGAGLSEAHLAEVLYGVEEEGVPYTLTSAASTDPKALAHAAAIASRLGIGIGAHGQTVVITTEKLPADRPYIIEKLNARRDLDRSVGANAARLVKRMPLRRLDSGEQP